MATNNEGRTFTSSGGRQSRAMMFFGESSPLSHVLSSTALLSLIGLLNRSLTVITQMAIASQFGATIYTDAYFATEIIPDLFIVLIGSGLSMAFIPHYSAIQSRSGGGPNSRDGNDGSNSTEQWQFASSFIFSLTLCFLLLTAILYVAAPYIVFLLAPGFHGEVREITISLFRIMVLTLAFLGPEAGLRGLFHTHREFATPDLSRFAYNLILLVAVLIFSERFSINSIGWGMVVGAAVMIVIQFVRAAQLGLIQRKWSLYHPLIASILRKTPAVLIVLAWPMVMPLIDRSESSVLSEGNLAALGYASRIAMLPIGIVVLPLSTVLYPGFSDLANQRAYKQIGEQLVIGLRMLVFVVLPVCVGILIGRDVIVSLLFERGQFDAVATLRTSDLLFYYTLSVPGFAMVFFLRGIFLSLDKSWSLCWISILIWLCNIGLNLLVVGTWAANGIAFTTALLTLVTPFIMLSYLNRQGLTLDSFSLLWALTRMALIAGIMAYVCQQIVSYGAVTFSADTAVGQLTVLAFGVSVSLIIYLGLSYIFRLPEITWLTSKVARDNASG